MTAADGVARGFQARVGKLLFKFTFGFAAAAALQMAAGQQPDATLVRASSSIRVTFDSHRPGLSALSVDSLKHGDFRPSPITDPGAAADQYVVTQREGWVRYALASDPEHPAWEMRCEGDTLRMRSLFRPGAAAQDVTWGFNPDITHATLLGRVTPAGDVALPAVLHLPGMGSMRIYAKGDASAALHYVAHRRPSLFVAVTFPAATAEHKQVEYTLETAAIYPSVPGVDPGDTRFDGFRRDWLNALQLQAEEHILANNAESDPCAIVLYFYSDIARYTPELVKGLSALDIVRQSLDRYLGGYLSYGMPGFVGFDARTPNATDKRVKYTFLDVYPSLLISAYDYVDGSGDDNWLRANYAGLRKWTETMIAPSADGSPLPEYPASGNSGSWGNPFTVRPANWWDAVGFGHQDAYSDALAYRALRSMAALAGRVGETADAARYRQRAQEIHDAFAPAFFDPATGVLAGWRSTDGQLHDYYFPFINGIAVRYGLIDGEQGRQVMSRILAKMQSVGFTDFRLGIPGNLVPIRRGDYVDLDPRFGGPKLEDGSDAFQVYQNGGTSACFAYFTLSALYRLGERDQADNILFPMLDGFSRQQFSGRAPNGLTYDWRDWKGGAHGYEGFLVDNYYALLAVLDRANMVARMP
jgi:hypothetical protein